MKSHRFSKPAKHQQGATLIEILVSILLMSVGIVSMAAMQVNAVKFSKTSEMRSLGMLLANDLADRMRANNAGSMSAYNNSNTTYAAPESAPSSARKDCQDAEVTCNFSEMKDYDLASWGQALFRQLPQGTGHVRSAANGQVDIWVVWTDPGSSIDQAADACPSGYNQPAGVRCMYFRVAL